MVTVLDLVNQGKRERHPEKAHRPDNVVLKKPDWIRVKAPVSRGYSETRDIVRSTSWSRFAKRQVARTSASAGKRSTRPS